MSPPFENTTYKIIYLTPEQISHLNSLVDMRLTELVLSNENPNIITMYRNIRTQLGRV